MELVVKHIEAKRGFILFDAQSGYLNDEARLMAPL
jgi:hypothetical protein